MQHVLTATDSLTPKHYFIAMLDVLGFKQIVHLNPLPSVVSVYQDLLNQVAQSGRVPNFDFAKGQTTIYKTRTVVMSDTIMLWAEDDLDKVCTLVTSCAHLMAHSNSYNWPLRGAIAFGEAVMDASEGIFVGQPIIDAYMAEQAQNWVGVAVHPNCFGSPNTGNALSKFDDFAQWTVPVKSSWNGPQLRHALRWHYGHDPVSELTKRAAAAPDDQKDKFQAAVDFATNA